MIRAEMSTAKLKKEALKQLETKPMSLAALAAAMELKEKKVFRLLRSLFEGGAITSHRGPDGARIYRPTTEEEKAASAAAKAKEAEEGEVVDVDEEDEEDDE
jgi:DNA-binding MarR family transcriptional regulator